MKIVNQQIKHILFGNGKIVKQEDDVMSIKFSEEFGVKMFIYPDAFDRFLKLKNSEVEATVLQDLHDKQERVKAEELMKQREHEDKARQLRELEKARTTVKKKKAPAKTKVAKKAEVQEQDDTAETES